MVTIEPKHLAAWKRASELTAPAVDEKPPTYGAARRQRAQRVVEHEPEAEAPGLVVDAE